MAIPTIKNRRDFLAAQASPQRCSMPQFLLQARLRPPDHPVQEIARIGYTVTKKMGNAVVRNRIKRRLREAVRLHALSYFRAGHDYVLMARRDALACDFSELARNMEIAFSRVHAKKEPSSASGTMKRA